MGIMKTVKATVLDYKHPDETLVNAFVDCPHCGREEFFLFPLENKRNIVKCESDDYKFCFREYIVEL